MRNNKGPNSYEMYPKFDKKPQVVVARLGSRWLDGEC